MESADGNLSPRHKVRMHHSGMWNFIAEGKIQATVQVCVWTTHVSTLTASVKPWNAYTTDSQLLVQKLRETERSSTKHDVRMYMHCI